MPLRPPTTPAPLQLALLLAGGSAALLQGAMWPGISLLISAGLLVLVYVLWRDQVGGWGSNDE